MAAGVIALPLDHVSQGRSMRSTRSATSSVHETRSAALPPFFSRPSNTRRMSPSSITPRDCSSCSAPFAERAPDARARHVRPVTWQSRSSPCRRSRRRRGPTLGKVPLSSQIRRSPFAGTIVLGPFLLSLGLRLGLQSNIPAGEREAHLCSAVKSPVRRAVKSPRWGCKRTYWSLNGARAVRCMRRVQRPASVSFASTLGARCASFASCPLICAIFGGYQNGN